MMLLLLWDLWILPLLAILMLLRVWASNCLTIQNSDSKGWNWQVKHLFTYSLAESRCLSWEMYSKCKRKWKTTTSSYHFHLYNFQQVAQLNIGKNSFAIAVQKKTFFQALNNVYDIPLSQLSSPCLKWDIVYVQILKEAYLEGLEECKNHYHSKIVLAKGDKSPTHLDVCKMMSLAWKSPLVLRRWFLLIRDFMSFCSSLWKTWNMYW